MDKTADKDCLRVSGRMGKRDHQKHHPFEFQIAAGAQRLRLRFRYAPSHVGEHENLCTLSLFDPKGFRGAAHRHEADQEIMMDAAAATPGFFAGPLYPGTWRAEINAHQVLNSGQGKDYLTFELEVVAEEGVGEAAYKGAGETAGEAVREAAGEMAAGEPVGEAVGERTAGEPVGEAVGEDTVDQRDRLPASASLHNRPGWYKGDLHSHSLHDDGHSSVTDMARAAAGRGLDFLATTGHNTTSVLADGNGWPADLLRIRGLECTTYFGHANVLGTAGWIDWRTDGPDQGGQWLLDQARRHNALLIINHPCDEGNPACTGCHWEYRDITWDQVDAIEIWNWLWHDPGSRSRCALARWTSLLNQGYRIPVVAGSDSHKAEDYEDQPDLPLIWVYADGLGEQQILAAVKAGHCFLSCGPEIYFTARGTDGSEVTLPGSQLPSQRPVTMDIVVEGLTANARLDLVVDGEVYQTWELDGPGARVQSDSLQSVKWCRLELYALGSERPGLLALTNPLYAG